MDVRLQVERVWIAPQLITQPSEVGSVPRRVRAVEEFYVAVEVLLLQGDPHTEPEVTIVSNDRQFNHAADKEAFVVDRTEVVGLLRNRLALLVAQRVLLHRRIEPEIGQPFVPLAATAAVQSEARC